MKGLAVAEEGVMEAAEVAVTLVAEEVAVVSVAEEDHP